MKVLFICNQGRHRSRTAAELFAKEFATKYAGLFSEERPVTLELLDWADFIVVMEDEQRLELSKRFPVRYLKKRIISLGVSDEYGYNDPELREILSLKFHQAMHEIGVPHHHAT